MRFKNKSRRKRRLSRKTINKKVFKENNKKQISVKTDYDPNWMLDTYLRYCIKHAETGELIKPWSDDTTDLRLKPTGNSATQTISIDKKHLIEYCFKIVCKDGTVLWRNKTGYNRFGDNFIGL